MIEAKPARTYSIREIANYIGLSRNTAQKHIKIAFPQFYREGERKTFYSQKEFRLITEEFL